MKILKKLSVVAALAACLGAANAIAFDTDQNGVANSGDAQVASQIVSAKSAGLSSFAIGNHETGAVSIVAVPAAGVGKVEGYMETNLQIVQTGQLTDAHKVAAQPATAVTTAPRTDQYACDQVKAVGIADACAFDAATFPNPAQAEARDLVQSSKPSADDTGANGQDSPQVLDQTGIARYLNATADNTSSKTAPWQT